MALPFAINLVSNLHLHADSIRDEEPAAGGGRHPDRLGDNHLDVRGDSREYTLNLSFNKPLIAFSYRATVQTKKDEWIEVKVPLEKFEATSFGRPVKDAGAVNPDKVHAMGFMLSDKKAGPFKLEVALIKGERVEESK